MKQLNWYQIFGNTHIIPDGKTVTPTDDIQTLLHCANIWDKSYTTIGEVIADDDTLFLTLIDNNAIDYLVRSTTFASSIVADESAMKYISASDYASDTLLANSTWLTAIDGSAYKDYVINASVPTMTSNTAPSGEASASHTSANAWKAFDGDSVGTSEWQGDVFFGSGTVKSVDGYIQYMFPSPVCVKKSSIGYYYMYAGEQIQNASILASNNGIDFETIKTIGTINSTSTGTMGNWQDYTLEDNTNHYKYYRLSGTWYHPASAGNAYRPGLPGLQFYGRENAGVQSWLKAGGITNKKYTTVSEVLSDLTTLATLMSSTDAIDYLVTAKGWATEICSDSNAMADIGMNNYAANTLLADETWREAICNSTYFTSVLNVSVPTMTDNTHPYGECYFDGNIYSGSAYNAYDKTSAYLQMTGNSNAVGYSRYRFPSLTKIYKAVVSRMNVNGTSYVGEIAGSLDNVTWDMLDSSQKTAVSDNTFVFPTVGDYYQYRVKLYHHSGTQYDGFVEVQFYGRKDI